MRATGFAGAVRAAHRRGDLGGTSASADVAGSAGGSLRLPVVAGTRTEGGALPAQAVTVTGQPKTDEQVIADCWRHKLLELDTSQLGRLASSSVHTTTKMKRDICEKLTAV